MKKYTKPTIAIAANSSTSVPVFCAVQADLDLIAGILGSGFDGKKIFGLDEPCEQPVPIDIYCKFTSAEMGIAQAFLS